MWAVTADVEEYDEALSWFLGRTILTDEQRLSIPAAARRNAFWVAGALQADQVQRVFDSLEQAIRKGEPFAEWRARVRAELRSDAHAETVFRNATQSAYNAGRYAQMTEPAALKFRPFWLYDAILDTRTTEVCKACHGTLLSADDPWWETHVPPLHHRCRSSIRNLRRTEAEKRGVTEKPPTDDVPGGWGAAPRPGTGWRPDPEHYDPVIAQTLAAKEPVLPSPPARRTLDDVAAGGFPRQPDEPPGLGAKLDQVAKRITPRQREAVEMFSAMDFTPTRDAQRLGLEAWQALYPDRSDYKELRKRALTIQASVEKLGGTKGGPQRLFRGMSLRSRTDADAFVNADFIVAESISSTSRDVVAARDFVRQFQSDGSESEIGVMLSLTNRHSGNILPIERISTIESEREVLVGAGKRYVVTSRELVTERDGYQVLVIHAEEMGPDAIVTPERVVRLQA